MKNLIVLLSFILWGVGCTQDSLNTDYNTNTMSRPSWISGGIPEMQAVILSPEESNPEPGGATLRGACDNAYVLQIKRISTHAGPITLRVFTKDADNAGYSAVINSMNLTAISDNTWTTVLLYDESTNEICFGTGDNLAFIQPDDFDEDIEFEARLFNVSGTLNTTPETILWDALDKFYYTLYPVASGSCMSNADTCCEYTFGAESVASSDGEMRFGFPWDATNYNLSVPPNANDSHTATNCGPILVSWKDDNHVTGNGYGWLEFDCGSSFYDWTIGSNGSIHGVLIDPFGRRCFIVH